MLCRHARLRSISHWPTRALPRLQAAAASLLSDVAALAAPGSLLLLDLLHSDALEGRAAPPGFANLARWLDAKGSPFRSATPPQFSGANVCRAPARDTLCSTAAWAELLPEHLPCSKRCCR